MFSRAWLLSLVQLEMAYDLRRIGTSKALKNTEEWLKPGHPHPVLWRICLG
jgi:hypothetical protein